MIKGDYDFLKHIASNNVCAEHQAILDVAWHSREKCWTLRCGQGTHRVPVQQESRESYQEDKLEPGHYPDSVTRNLSLTEAYKAGEEFPEPIQSNIKKSLGRRFMSNGKETRTELVSGLMPFDLATGERLTDEAITALVEYAERYKLDPYRGHVCLMYSKPYITIDGYLFHAMQTKRPYSLQSRPMTTQELPQYKVVETDHGWLAKVVFTDTGDEFTGLGIVTYDEMTEKSKKDSTKLRSPVVAAHPWQLGQKRAEWQALRRAFPIGESE